RGAPHPGRPALHHRRARPRPSPPAHAPLGDRSLVARRRPGPGRPRHMGAPLRAGSPTGAALVTIDRLAPGSGLQAFPPPETWDDWREYDPKQWPRRVEKRYMLVPTICFNCEAACGLLAYVDKETMRVRKFEGNPLHPASRGRNCAKGPATINQINDPERILYP